MTQLLFLVACLFSFGLVHAVVGASFGVVLRVGLKAIRVGMGPRVLRFHVGGVPVELRLVPISGGVVFPDGDDAANGAADRSFRDAPMPLRVVTFVSAPLVLLGLGALAVGFTDAGAEITSAVVQLAIGAWSPLDEGAPLVQSWLRVADVAPVAAWGVLAIKYAVLELLPIPGGPAGNAMLEFLECAVGLRHDDGLGRGLQSAGVLLFVAIQVSWAVATASALF